MTTAIRHPSYALEDRCGTRDYAPLPVMLERGGDAWLSDTDGRRYLNIVSAHLAVSFGHSRPKFMATLMEQADRLMFTSCAFHNTGLRPFLADVCHITRMNRALSMSTDAEAVEIVIKVVRKWTRDMKGLLLEAAEIVVFDNSFHGRTTTTVGFFSYDQYRYGLRPSAAGSRCIPFGDADTLCTAIGSDIDAILMESVQGEGDIVEPPAGYLRFACELATRHNVLLVRDEVQTGPGRTGGVLASWHEGTDADLVVLGKILGGGMVPVLTIIGHETVVGAFHPGDHGSTFGDNLLTAHTGRTALALLMGGQLPQRAIRVGAVFINELRTLVGHGVRQVRGHGLMIGLQLDADIDAHDFTFALAGHGVPTKDTYDNVIRLTPSSAISEAELAPALDAIRQTLVG